MKRDINSLSQQLFDVVVIGGGVYGAAMVRAAAFAGLRTALIEQKDFCHATSANSLKIIHGGFRYLKNMDIRRVREAIRARRDAMAFAPHLVKPLRCIMPTSRTGLHKKEVMSLALKLNDVIGWDRNRNVHSNNCIPRGKILSRKEYLKLCPALKNSRFNGAALWYDGLALNTERLVLAFVHDAMENGAVAANYVQCTDLILRNDRIVGVTAQDHVTNKKFDIRARVVINAAGPWIEKILRASLIIPSTKYRWAKAVNIVIKKPLVTHCGLGLEGRYPDSLGAKSLSNEKRYYFFVPWRGYTVLGTIYKSYLDGPDNFSVGKNDIEELITVANTIYPNAALSFRDVTFFHGGILPMENNGVEHGNDVQLERRSRIIDHKIEHGVSGLYSIRGIKYTTATETAKDIMKVLAQQKDLKIKVMRNRGHSMTDGNQALPVSDFHEAKGGEARKGIIKRLKREYGCHYIEFMKYIEEESQTATLVSEEPPITIAEILHAVRDEMALRLSDIVFRRTGLGTAECPSQMVLEKVADIVAKELCWDENQKIDEIRDVLSHYAPLKVAERLHYDAKYR